MASNAQNTPSTSKDQQTLTLNQEQIDALGVLIRSAAIGNRRGNWSLEESNVIFKAVQLFAPQEAEELQPGQQKK